MVSRIPAKNLSPHFPSLPALTASLVNVFINPSFNKGRVTYTTDWNHSFFELKIIKWPSPGSFACPPLTPKQKSWRWKLWAWSSRLSSLVSVWWPPTQYVIKGNLEPDPPECWAWLQECTPPSPVCEALGIELRASTMQGFFCMSFIPSHWRSLWYRCAHGRVKHTGRSSGQCAHLTGLLLKVWPTPPCTDTRSWRGTLWT